MPAVLTSKTHLMPWSADQEDGKMLLDIPFPMNNVINDQLTLKLIDIYFDNMLQISAKLGKLTSLKSLKFGV